MIAYDLSYGDYAAAPGLRWSTLRHIGESPRHCQHAELSGDHDTTDRKFLRAVHAAVLENRQDHVVWTGDRRQGKVWDLFADLHRDREILTSREDARLQAVVQAIRGHGEAAELLSTGHPEVSVFWGDYKARIDWLGPDYIADLKTLGTTDTGAVARMHAIREYHGQLAHYVDGARANGIEIRRAYLIVAEGDGAQDVAVFDVDDRALDVGLALRDRYAATYRECARTGVWPGRHPKIAPLGLPEWAVPQDDSEGSDNG